MKHIITFVGLFIITTVSHAQNLYGDMEQWRNVSVFTDPNAGIQNPLHWTSTDSAVFMVLMPYPSAQLKRQAFRTTDAHGGVYAAMLMTADEDIMGKLPALMTNADMHLNIAAFDPNDPYSALSFTGGTAVGTQVPGIEGWFKYLPKGNDTAVITVQAIIEQPSMPDAKVAKTTQYLYAHSGWTHFIVPLNYTDTLVPTTLQIFIASSTQGSATDSSILYVDDISIIPLSVTSLEKQVLTCKVYPNPCNNHLYLETYASANVDIYNVIGTPVFKGKIAGRRMIDISSWAEGVYFLNIADEHGIWYRQCFSVLK